MISKYLFRPLHEHADPAQRVQGVAALPADAPDLALLLAEDPAPEVRAAAAARCTDVAALGAAWRTEADAGVRSALAAALGAALAATADAAAARTTLESPDCPDALRADVARRAADPERRRLAVATLQDEETLVDVALTAEHAETRLAAAERVHAPAALRKLADAARNKDNGVARLARKRLDALAHGESQAAEADAILAELEALATTPGAILSPLVELDRRWHALDPGIDTERRARVEAARQTLQARLDKEREDELARVRLHRRLDALGARDVPADEAAIAAARAELDEVRAEVGHAQDAVAQAKLAAVAQRIDTWAQERVAHAGALALVEEAEALAAGTSIDDAKLPDRWQALDRAIRTPDLTRRFEAALIVVEQRRLAQAQAAEQSAKAARAQLHALLHTAEQALAAGELKSARAAADEIKARKPEAGVLPKPTNQRLGRLLHQLGELERWESFGQQHARVQLCERAEALATATLEPPKVANEVKKLRDEWKALDQQHAGVPKSLWERFDRACEKAYAPAARHFAQVAAQKKESRQRRDEFIAAAAAHVPTLLAAEPRDWRAIEHWLRDTDRAWREGDLGSVDPKAWKGFDNRLREALAPARDALGAARTQAKAARQALIDEATALAAKAMDRDAPTQVKTLHAKWQVIAKEVGLPQRDERALWESFRAACNAVFDARKAKRKEVDGARHEHLRGLEALCVEAEQLAAAGDKPDGEVRRALRDLADQWRKRAGGHDPALRGVESRFRAATAAVEAALASRARSREAAGWQTLAAKERLCEEVDAQLRAGGELPAEAPLRERWAALPALPPAWEKTIAGRLDAALRALGDAGARDAYVARMDRAVEPRREMLLALEIALGLESPAQFAAQRLALQVKQLKQRFENANTPGAGAPQERLLAWCAEPGVADAADRERIGKVLAAMEKAR
ncbi:MAG: DUF349 domain-containing protein [Burkholderiales bacterium]